MLLRRVVGRVKRCGWKELFESIVAGAAIRQTADIKRRTRKDLLDIVIPPLNITVEF